MMARNVTLFDDHLLLSIQNQVNFEEVKSTIAKEDLYNVTDSKRNTLLHYAVQYRNTEILQYLKDSGCSVDTPNALGQTPLMLTVIYHYWDAKMMEYFIEAGADMFVQRDCNGKSALQMIGECHWLRDKSLQLILKNLQSDCSNVLEKIAERLFGAEWPLAKIVQFNFPELTKIMLEYGHAAIFGIDTVTSNYLHQTALHIAVKSVNLENVKLLLEYNANANIMDTNKRLPLSYVYDYDRAGQSDEKTEIFKILLERTASDCIIPRELYSVFRYGNKEATKLLFRRNVDPMSDVYGPKDMKIVHALAQNKNPGVLEQLRGRTFDINVRNNQLETPLMIAVSLGNAGAIEFLIGEGADMDAVDKHGSTVLSIAIRLDWEKEEGRKCVQNLLEGGLNVQLIADDDPVCPTIFDFILDSKKWKLGELVLAYLALLEAKGTAITTLVRRKIYSHARFEDFFEFSKQQLALQVNRSITLFDLLTATDKRLERHMRNEELVAKIQNLINLLSKNYYFETILRKRISKAIDIVTLKRKSARVICKIMQTCYERFPYIADQLVDYLDPEDMVNLISTLI